MDDKKKVHRVSKSRRKAKSAHDTKKDENVDPVIRNPKAFAINSVVRAERKFRRARDIQTKKERAPQVDRAPVEPPPIVIAIVGPPKVGKSTLFHNLTKHFTRHVLHDVKGPVTIVSGKKRRLTLIECNNDIHSMIDTAKVADLVLLLVDASFGFEMEIFEFLNICQVHGFPQIMGVLTHLDLLKNKVQLKKTKKTLKHRFWTEVYPGSKLFYLSGYHPMTNSYPKNEIHNLARFISVMKVRQTSWRSQHAYVVVDRIEDLTSPEDIRLNSKVDRNICLYGYVHGTFLKPDMPVHIPGLGDYTPEAVNALDDPCPLPMKERILRRSLNEKEKVIYAPFSGVGGIVYDQDAVYIDLAGSHSHSHQRTDEREQEMQPSISPFVSEIQKLKASLDEKMESSGLQLFSTSRLITPADGDDVRGTENFTDVDDDYEEVDENTEIEITNTHQNVEIVRVSDGRRRRKVIFNDEDEGDVISEMQTEINNLKQSANDNYSSSAKNNVTSSERTSNEESSHDTAEDFEVENLCAPLARQRETSTANVTSVKRQAHDNSVVDVSSLALKLKARLDKNAAVPVACAESDSDLTDEGIAEFSEENDSDMELGEDGKDEKEESVLGKKELTNTKFHDRQQDDDFSDEPSHYTEITKKKSYLDAEAGFYSRFYKRSLQRAIYEPATEHFNIGPKADFDLANCAVDELTGVQRESNIGDEKMKGFFIGGEYAEAAKNILEDDAESTNSCDGDFQELDKAKDDEDEEDGSDQSCSGLEKQQREDKKREEMKKQLKEKFDMQYDASGNGKEKDFYAEWKSEVEEQTKVNQTFFKDVEDPALLQDLQGIAPGTYVRCLLLRLPCEFVTNFDPQTACPLILGSLDSPNQETLAVVQARIKKHRWHRNILKNRDAIILSVGWRRFQTVALYSIHDHNMRNRMIKYTPEHLHCVANFYGPITPQGTGILGIAPDGFDGFRITLTGTILDMDKSTELVKKLKLIGHPAKIFKKSAFVNGMFNSQLEVAKFVGAKIKTVSGIRGVIKKQLRTPAGSFRATFEDRILLSDVVFCRTWANVDIPKFYLTIPNLVVPNTRLVKTVGQLKRESQVKATPDPDHLYTPVVRATKEFKPLQIPKKLQERLPYMDKPKVKAKCQEVQRIAVIKEPHERKMTTLLSEMKSRMSKKEAKVKLERGKKATEKAKVQKRLEEQQTRRQKELRKKIFRTLGKMKPTKK